MNTKKLMSCDHCGTNNAKYSCGNCKTVSYCSKNCQTQNWKLHASQCQLIGIEKPEKEGLILKFKNLGIEAKYDRFNGLHINIGKETSTDTMQKILVELTGISRKTENAAIYLYFPLLGPKQNLYSVLQTKSNESFTWKPFTQTKKYSILYTWIGPSEDKVQSVATSIAGVHVLITDKSGEYCLLVLSKEEEPKWSFVGGAVDIGETDLDAAKREVSEEVGININDLPLDRFKILAFYNQKNARKHGNVFESDKKDEILFISDHWCAIHVQLDQDINSPIKFQESEALDAKWFKFKELNIENKKTAYNSDNATKGQYPIRGPNFDIIKNFLTKTIVPLTVRADDKNPKEKFFYEALKQ